ncbi:MAG: double-strand break repair helicase AddA [Pararhodobacter sp.]
MDEPTRRQVAAAAPEASTWLSANAGSGKTRVLTNRVARLLLRGVEPQRILCLTYTKAAASEMQNRLFAGLGAWAMLEARELEAALTGLGESIDADPEVIARARRLFARAIETPGGLKIQTIHSFCSALLRRFPLEAGVPPDFTEIEERSLRQLQLELLEDLAAGADAVLLRDLAALVPEATLLSVLDELGKHRDVFEPGQPVADLPELLGLSADDSEAHLIDEVFLGGEAALVSALVPLLLVGGTTDQRLAEGLAAAATPGIAALAALEKVLLFTRSAATPHAAKLGKLGTKAVRLAAAVPLLDALDDLARRVEAARPRRLALALLARSRALHAFARRWAVALGAAKARRGWLDFDDLILRARRLLSDPQVAQWVLFKLDGGIDHILIDEAQDTSPQQWAVIERLTQEFTAGQGAREALRTIFVVGDKKQSIYSFQGADLRGFDRMRSQFDRALADAGQRLNHMELQHSFRSSEAVLRLVDHCFAPQSGAAGMGGAVEHLAFHATMPGRVDLWPAVPRPETEDPGAWDDPLDRPGEDNHEVQLARIIADEIHAMIERGERIGEGEGARPVHEGDFLILVQRRKLLFHELIRACKARGLAIAGADRLVLSEQLAVQDLIALLKFLALPEDDLSLAAVLRSPLFGWSEDRLYRLAQGRGAQHLWARLRADPQSGETLAILDDLRGQADFLRPYELLERALTRHDGRRRLMARFGPEAEDAIEAFVGLALRYEQGQIPSIDGFVNWLQASDAEIKRQPEAAGRRIRVMTVHGAKGLESPIVILPDTAARKNTSRSSLAVVDGQPILRANAEEAPEAQRIADAEQAESRREENDRLLYVALTRAERWLIIAGAGDTETADCWYARLQAAMTALGGWAQAHPTGRGMRFEHGIWPSAQPAISGVLAVQGDAAQAPAGPLASDTAALMAPLPAPRAAARPLSPSDLGGAKALAGEAGEPEDIALRRGRLVHRLLEHLPALPVSARAQAGVALLADPDASAEERAACLEEVLRLLDAAAQEPSLARMLGGAAMTEVALCGNWHGQPMLGVIDRLLVADNHVLAVDFKTNRVVPPAPEAVPEGLLRQMGAYGHLLGALYPGRKIETALLWTSTMQLMALPSQLTGDALARAAGAPGNADRMAPDDPAGDTRA